MAISFFDQRGDSYLEDNHNWRVRLTREEVDALPGGHWEYATPAALSQIAKLKADPLLEADHLWKTICGYRRLVVKEKQSGGCLIEICAC